jgi:hypothetical protein
VAFQLWICLRYERGKDEFNDQQTAVLRNDCAAVPEALACGRSLRTIFSGRIAYGQATSQVS